MVNVGCNVNAGRGSYILGAYASNRCLKPLLQKGSTQS